MLKNVEKNFLQPTSSLVACCWTLLIFLFCVVVARGYMQELILYEPFSENEPGMTLMEPRTIENGTTAHWFRSSVPNGTIYPFLGKVNRFCFRGIWNTFSDTNYGNISRGFNGENSLQCRNETFSYKSWRHEAASETHHDAVSLYADYYWTGQETFVNHSHFNLATAVTVHSMSNSGPSNWTIFEETNFTGKTFCLPGRRWGHIGSLNGFVNYGGWTTVGSLMKGCSPKRRPHGNPQSVVGVAWGLISHSPDKQSETLQF